VRISYSWRHSSGNAYGAKQPNKETLPGCIWKVAETLGSVCVLPRRLLGRWWCRIGRNSFY
jgi:hypothetical protein